MKKILGTLTILSIAFLTVAMSSVKNENQVVNQDTKHIFKNVKADEFKKLIDAGHGIILDVRTADEFVKGHIEGAVNIDYYGKTFKEELNKLDKSKAIYVYCHSGGRSGKSMKMMTSMGFTEVYNLIGGFSNWPYKK